jgi:hypothetical protein
MDGNTKRGWEDADDETKTLYLFGLTIDETDTKAEQTEQSRNTSRG